MATRRGRRPSLPLVRERDRGSETISSINPEKSNPARLKIEFHVIRAFKWTRFRLSENV